MHQTGSFSDLTLYLPIPNFRKTGQLQEVIIQ